MPRDVRKLRDRSQYAKGVEESLPQHSMTGDHAFTKRRSLRYGENPPAYENEGGAAMSREEGSSGSSIPNARVLHEGKPLSYNNILDGDTGIRLAYRLHQIFSDAKAAVIMKHDGPCGVAMARTMEDAHSLAYLSDQKSALGGVNIYTDGIDAKTARLISAYFNEVVIAPDYTRRALAILREKKDLRVLQVDSFDNPIVDCGIDERSILGGKLYQQRMVSHIDSARNLEQVSNGRRPTQIEINAALFTWAVAFYTQSNAIVVGNNYVTSGIGRGQPNRVDSVQIALYNAEHESKGPKKPKVMASDAFFPFPDSIEYAGNAGVSAIVFPLGSINDEEVLKTAEKYGIVMLCTRPIPGTDKVERGFRH